MDIILILIAVSLSIALVFLLIFVWCLRSGQYDDSYTPSVRMLFENEMSDRGDWSEKPSLYPEASPKSTDCGSDGPLKLRTSRRSASPQNHRHSRVSDDKPPGA